MGEDRQEPQVRSVRLRRRSKRIKATWLSQVACLTT